MTSEGLGEQFEGLSADTCAGKFPLVLMGGERRVSHAQTWERGPPSTLAEIFFFLFFLPLLFKIPEGVVVGFQIFAWTSN
jgi:hypothetical protein